MLFSAISRLGGVSTTSTPKTPEQSRQEALSYLSDHIKEYLGVYKGFGSSLISVSFDDKKSMLLVDVVGTDDSDKLKKDIKSVLSWANVYCSGDSLPCKSVYIRTHTLGEGMDKYGNKNKTDDVRYKLYYSAIELKKVNFDTITPDLAANLYNSDKSDGPILGF